MVHHFKPNEEADNAAVAGWLVTSESASDGADVDLDAISLSRSRVERTKADADASKKALPM